MKKSLHTFSVILLIFFSSAVTAQEVPGGHSNGVDTIEAGPQVQFNLTNYPNPVNTKTAVKYDIPADARVSLKLYNLSGQLVTTIYAGDKKAGSHTIDFNASNIARGIYVCRLSVTSGIANKSLSRKMNVVK